MMSQQVKQVLAQKVANIIGSTIDKVLGLLSSGATSYSQPHPGSTWVTVLQGTWFLHDGIVLSAYFHPTKTHTATTIGKVGTKRSTANAGEWAIFCQTRAAFGNKSYYSTQG